MYSREKDMYPDIIDSISKELEFRGYEYKVYRTWETFDQELKDLYPSVTSILNKDALPDITVIYKNASGERKCLIIEVKIDDLIAKDIAQAKMYGDIYNADSVLLVSLIKIRKSFIEFHTINKNFLKCSNGSQLYTCVLENGNLILGNCFPPIGGVIK